MASAGAASSGKDVLENDAQSSADFLNRIDKATAFVTRSVLCVVLLEPSPDGEATGGGGDDEMRARAVIQLINKKGSDDAPWTADDVVETQAGIIPGTWGRNREGMPSMRNNVHESLADPLVKDGPSKHPWAGMAEHGDTNHILDNMPMTSALEGELQRKKSVLDNMPLVPLVSALEGELQRKKDAAAGRTAMARFRSTVDMLSNQKTSAKAQRKPKERKERREAKQAREARESGTESNEVKRARLKRQQRRRAVGRISSCSSRGRPPGG